MKLTYKKYTRTEIGYIIELQTDIIPLDSDGIVEIEIGWNEANNLITELLISLRIDSLTELLLKD